MPVVALVLIAAASLLPAACGGDEDSEGTAATQPPTTTTADDRAPGKGRGLSSAGADRPRYIGRSGTATKTACELVSTHLVERLLADAGARKPEPLERSANDSLDLSFCEWRETAGPDLYVKLTLDTATRAVRRYYNLIAEARQFPTSGFRSQSDSPQLVPGVGDDGTYGGTGAFWIRSQADLTAIRDQRIVKVHFYVPGAPNAQNRDAAAELARRAFAGYGPS